MAKKKEKIEQVEQVEETVEEIVKPYTFRRLNATDLLQMSQVIKKIGIDNFANVFVKAYGNFKAENEEQEALQMGMLIFDVLQLFIAKYEDCHKELFNLMAKTSNLSLEELQQLDFDVYLGMLTDFVKKEEFATFSRAVLKSLGMAN